ncbi:hypothetical protein DENIT_60751 [Pseudomonas veronii]|nr:hypothetical protein DENIT_60751 [Pseudomonas veronii]
MGCHLGIDTVQLWEGGLLAMAVGQSHVYRLNHCYREQAPSHTDPAPDTQCMNTAKPMWEGACSR